MSLSHHFLTNSLSPKIQRKIDEDTARYRALYNRQSDEAKLAATDFLTFRKYVCGHDSFEHMMLWHKVLNTGQDNKFLRGIGGQDTCILAPRNSSKSTFLLQWVSWIIGTHANAGISLKILYISYTSEVSASKSRQIKAIIESELYRQVFPRVRPSKTMWAERQWGIDFQHAGLSVIDEPYTLATSGLKGSINSKRAHILVIDDPVKSPAEAGHKRTQDKLLENWNQIVRFTKYDGSRAICLGTRMGRHDAYARIFVPQNGWKQIVQKALIEENGQLKSFWEPVSKDAPGLSLQMLLEERDEHLDSFLLQRQNEVPKESFEGINHHLIRYSWLPQRFERLIIGLDLASSSTGDYTAMVLVGVEKDLLYVCDCYQERIQGNMRKIDVLYDLWARRGDMCRNQPILAVDANKYAIDFRGDLLDYLNEMDDNGKLFKYMNIESVKSAGRGEKIDRLMSHSLLFQKHRIKFNQLSSDGGKSDTDKLIKQITDYNPMDSNDLMDAFEMALLVGRNYLLSEISYAN